MTCILITGAIASGKSAVCRYLEQKAYPVFDCDSRTKDLYDKVPGLRSRIENSLGISWSQINVIFTDTAKRECLESIVYPYLLEDINAWKSAQTSDLVFIESAVALDKVVLTKVFDRVLLISADYQQRWARNSKVAQRDAIQHYDLSKVDYIIENDSSLEDLFLKVDGFLCSLSRSDR